MRSLTIFLHDLCAALLAWMLAFAFRFNFEIPAAYQQLMLNTSVGVVAVQALICWRFGLYRGVWRFASIPDLRRIFLAALVGALCIAMLLFMRNRLSDVPRSVLLLDPMLLVLIMGGSRFIYRAWKDGHLLSPSQLDAEPVIILGAGEAAALLLRDLIRDPHWSPVALLDDNSEKTGLRIMNVPVFGPFSRIDECVKRFAARYAIVAIPSASVSERRRLADLAAKAGLSVLILPAISDVLAGKVSVSQVRSVELEDLLGRDPVMLDDAGLSLQFAEKTVLVTGAGGSIGSELCRQIARFSPARLVLFELSEFALYRIEQEFQRIFPSLDLVCIVGDIKDVALISQVFETYRPVVVFHAAAYKHVPMMENVNAWQAVRNNALGTLRVAKAAAQYGVSEFVLISTDKAVNPTNVMGATKRLAERICQAVQAQTQSTCFVVVRFGNVLGSSGSVIPKFREQIAAGGPVTVTHAEITRYFMLIPEACQLVLQAGLQANENGQSGRVFVLDMGEPVRIYDLARDMIRLSGCSEDEIRIEVTGLRPGEKLYEELLADSEQTLPTPHPKLRIAMPDVVPDGIWLDDVMAWLMRPVCDEEETKQQLQRYVPEYVPSQH